MSFIDWAKNKGYDYTSQENGKKGYVYIANNNKKFKIECSDSTLYKSLDSIELNIITIQNSIKAINSLEAGACFICFDHMNVAQKKNNH